MVKYLKKALENDKGETDCPSYQYQKGMAFDDRVRRLVRAVMKYEEKEKKKGSKEIRNSARHGCEGFQVEVGI